MTEQKAALAQRYTERYIAFITQTCEALGVSIETAHALWVGASRREG